MERAKKELATGRPVPAAAGALWLFVLLVRCAWKRASAAEPVAAATSASPEARKEAGVPVKEALAQRKVEQLRSGGAAAEAKDLFLSELKWSDAEGVALVGALRAAHERGGLQQLETLHVEYNQMGDETAAAKGRRQGARRRRGRLCAHRRAAARFS